MSGRLGGSQVKSTISKGSTWDFGDRVEANPILEKGESFSNMTKGASWQVGDGKEEERRKTIMTSTPGLSTTSEDSENELSPEDYEEQLKNELLRPESTK